MTFIFTCPYCGNKSEAEDDWVGQDAECLHCHKTVTIEKQKIVLRPIQNGPIILLKPLQNDSSNSESFSCDQTFTPEKSKNTTSNQSLNKITFNCEQDNTKILLNNEQEKIEASEDGKLNQASGKNKGIFETSMGITAGIGLALSRKTLKVLGPKNTFLLVLFGAALVLFLWGIKKIFKNNSSASSLITQVLTLLQSILACILGGLIGSLLVWLIADLLFPNRYQ